MAGPSAKAGIGFGIANFANRISDSLREQKDRERLEVEREEARRWREVERGLRLAEMGGGMGPAPTERVTLGERLMAPPREFQVPEGPLTSTEPSGGLGVRVAADTITGPVPEFEPREFSYERPDPRYMDLGDGTAHVLKPDVRRESERAMEAAAARREREGRIRGYGEALMGLGFEDPDALAVGMEAGVPTSVLFPGEPETPTVRVHGRTFPDTPAGRAEAEAWQRRMGAAGRAPTGGPSLNPVDDQRAGFIATEILQEVDHDPRAALDRVRARHYDPLLQSAIEEEVWRQAGQVRRRDSAGGSLLDEYDVDPTGRSGAGVVEAPTVTLDTIRVPPPAGRTDDAVTAGGPPTIRPPGDRPRVDGARAAGWQERARQLRRRGMDDDQVVEQLRAEGYLR